MQVINQPVLPGLPPPPKASGPPAQGTLAQMLRAALTECIVCGAPGWAVDLGENGSVTLHSELTTPAGDPILGDACWASEG